MRMLDCLKQLKPETYRVARRDCAERVWVFGSCAREEETPESDVDLLIGLNHEATLFDQVSIFPDVLIHRYFGVDLVNVWNVAKHMMPQEVALIKTLPEYPPRRPFCKDDGLLTITANP